MLTAAELQRRGREATNAGRLAEARRLLTRALERADDADTRARSLVTLAHLAAERGNRDDGLALCAQARAESGLSDGVLGLVHSQEGLLCMRAGDLENALGHFALAEPLLTQDLAALARLHLNRGNIHLQQRDTASAAHAFDIAQKLADDPVEQAKAEHNLGYARLLQGDLVAALQHMERADAVLDPLSPFLRAVDQQDRAEVLTACGMTTEAAVLLREAVSTFAHRRLRQAEAEAELALARLLLADEPAAAGHWARRAAVRFRARGSDAWSWRAEAVALGAAVATGTPVGDWSSLHDRLATAGLRRDAQVVALHAGLADVSAAHLDDAAASVRRANVRGSAPVTTRLLDREVRASIAAARGRAGSALGHVRAGLDDLVSWQATFGSLDLQTSLAGHGQRLALLGLRLALARGHPDIVLEWAERGRALSSRVAPLRPPGDDALAADLAELRALQPAVASAEDLAAERRAALLRRRIRERAWQSGGQGFVRPAASLEEVQAGLGPAVLVSYLAVDDGLHALVTTPNRAELVAIGELATVVGLLPGLRADLDMAAADLPEALRAAVLAGLGSRLDSLDRSLWRPVAPVVGDAERIVVVPPGSLAGVPWSLLPGLAGRPLTVALTASRWLEASRVPITMDSAGLVAGPDVPRAPAEVRRAATAWSGRAEESASDPALVSDLATRVDVLHVAAHGLHSADNPLFSGLRLAGGTWYGYDIDQLTRVPQVVVLSACEAGRSEVRWRDELLGMAIAWQHAGTRCVVAASTLVGDAAATEVLGRLHDHLARGVPPADALAASAGTDGLTRSASFVCFGAGW